MRRIKEISIVILLILLFVQSGSSYQDTENKNVLVLFALAPTTQAYLPILNGIRQKLIDNYGDSFTLHTEYLGLEAYGQEKFPKEIFDAYNLKYKNLNIDLLICVGINIIPIVRDFGENYLLNLPTISIDLDFSKYGMTSDIVLNEKTTKIALKVNLEASIENALKLFPNTKSIYFIGGVSKADKLLFASSKIAAAKLNKIKDLYFITDASMDEVINRVKKIPSNSIIFVPNFQTDNKNVPYSNHESVRLICKSTNVPVFAPLSSGFGVGSVGGYLLNFNKVGLLAGDCAIKILYGADPKTILITEKDYYEYLYDWRALKRWNLVSSDLLPAGSTIMYENISFVDRYKWVGGLIVLFFLLQTILITNLVRLNKKQKVIAEQLVEYQNKYKDLLHTDRSLKVSQLTASLSHELNQPLTAILSTAQAGINFINSNEATPDLLKQILQKIVFNDKRTASILSSIRGMLKLETRGKEKVNVNNLINNILAVYRSETVVHNIELNVKLPLEQVYVIADPVQIEQVILNFLLNSSQSLVKINIKKKIITVSLTIKDENVIVSVEDNGTGINEAIKEKLFTPFTTSKPQGMGIGLALCRTIIEDHNGKIWAANLAGSGAIFSFSIKRI